MAKNKFDWKKLLVEKGERVGLGVAGLLALLLILSSVKSYLGAGPTKNAQVLNKDISDLKTKLANNAPDPSLVASLSKIAIDKFNYYVINDPAQFKPEGELFAASAPGDDSRQQPNLLKPVEGTVVYVQGQVMTYIFKEEGGVLKVKALKSAADPEAGQPPPA